MHPNFHENVEFICMISDNHLKRKVSELIGSEIIPYISFYFTNYANVLQIVQSCFSLMIIQMPE